jgi:hypothetical protein
MTPSAYHLQHPDGQSITFTLVDAEQLDLMLRSGDWVISDRLKETWEVEIYAHRSGEVIQILSRTPTMAAVLQSEENLFFLNRKMVPYVTLKKRFTPFLLLEKEQVDGILLHGGLARIGTHTVGGITEIYLMPDGRVFTVDDTHWYGEIFLSLEDYKDFEEDMRGSGSPMVMIPSDGFPPFL